MTVQNSNININSDTSQITFNNKSNKYDKNDRVIDIVTHSYSYVRLGVGLKESLIRTKGKLSFESQHVESFSEYNSDYIYNIDNITPNPLYDGLVNDKFTNINCATSDLDGIPNTSYLRLSKNDNIAKNIQQDYYIPSIGELSIAMENIQTINDGIDSLGGEYSQYKIPYDAVITSSTLYSQSPIQLSDYKIINNISNVWCFNNTEAEISYKPLFNKFTVLPFYKFIYNDEVNLDYDIDGIVLNSLYNSSETLNILKYLETNKPIHNIKIGVDNISDFNIENWEKYPFSAKYIFNMLFPEVKEYFNSENKLTDLHNRYLEYYTYLNSYFYNTNGLFGIRSSYYAKTPSYSFLDIENNSLYKYNVNGNNGVALPINVFNEMTYRITYINYGGNTGNNENNKFDKIEGYSYYHYNITYSTKSFTEQSYYVIEGHLDNSYLFTNTNETWKQYLIYNASIYGNHLVLMPTYGSGENNYNCIKNKAKATLYVAMPMTCTDFSCEVSGKYDCNIKTFKHLDIDGFSIYCIEFIFNVHIPTDNMITFKCKYKGGEIVKKYYYSIYSFTIYDSLDNNTNTYIDIGNYYVAKDPYNWWNFNKWNNIPTNWKKSSNIEVSYYEIDGAEQDYAVSYTYTFKDGFGKLLDQSYSLTNIRFNYKTSFSSETYLVGTNEDYNEVAYSNKYTNIFNSYNSTYFNHIYDLSYLINNIDKNIDVVKYNTSNNRGLRVDRVVDQDIFKNIIINSTYNNILMLGRTNKKLEFYPFNNSIISYCYFINSKFKYINDNGKLTYNYHLLPLSSYYYSNKYAVFNNVYAVDINESISESSNSADEYNNNYSRRFTRKRSDIDMYKPIIRIEHCIDEFGLYKDLMFLDVTTGVSDYTTIYYSNIIKDDNKYLSVNKCNNYDNINTIVWDYKSIIQNNNELQVGYFSKFKLNIPIVGAKQNLCLGLDMNKYVEGGLFKRICLDKLGYIYSNNNEILKKDQESLNISYFVWGGKYNNNTISNDSDIIQLLDDIKYDWHYYYNYIFSDYLFLYNNTKTILKLMVVDPLLSISNKQYTLIELKPNEFRLYYPNNFDYKNVNGEYYKNGTIYHIKIINKTSSLKDLKIHHYELGQYNLSFEEMYNAFKYDNVKPNVQYHNYESNDSNSNNETAIKNGAAIKGSMDDQIGYKLVTNLMYLHYLYKYRNIVLSKEDILGFYNRLIKTKQYIRGYVQTSEIQTILHDLNHSNKKIFRKILVGEDNLNIDTTHTYINNIDIGIKNYKENYAGHLCIFETNKQYYVKNDPIQEIAEDTIGEIVIGGNKGNRFNDITSMDGDLQLEYNYHKQNEIFIDNMVIEPATDFEYHGTFIIDGGNNNNEHGGEIVNTGNNTGDNTGDNVHGGDIVDAGDNTGDNGHGSDVGDNEITNGGEFNEVSGDDNNGHGDDIGNNTFDDGTIFVPVNP